MENGFTQVLLQGGMASVIVVAWFFFNKANMSAFTAILQAQTKRDDANFELLRQVIDTQNRRADAQDESTQLIIGHLSDIKHIASAKCPLQQNNWGKEYE